MSIPELDHGTNSWVVTRKADGSVIGEFYNRDSIAKFNPEKCLIETAHQYLCRINHEIKQVPL